MKLEKEKLKRQSSKHAEMQYLRLEPEHQDLQMHRRKSFNLTEGSMSTMEREMERVRRENLEKRLMNKTIHSQRGGRPPSNRTSTITMTRSPSHGFVRGHGGHGNQSSGRSSLRYTEGRASQSMRLKKISVGSRNIEPVSFQIG